MPKDVDVVINPRARRLSSGSLRDRVRRQAERLGARVHETGDLDAVRQAASDIASSGTSAVVLVGGDGSCMAGVSALADAFGETSMPPIAFASAGTVGTVARNVGAGRLSNVDRVLDAVCANTARPVKWPSLRVADDRGGRYVGFIFGGGLVQRFFELYDASPRGLGPAAAIATRLFAGSLTGSPLAQRVLEPMACSLTVDGVTHPHARWSLFLASVVRDAGLHFQVTYRAGEDASRFHFVASGLPSRSLGPRALLALAGQPLGGDPLIDTLTPSLRVDFHERGGGYVLDGDMVRAEQVSVGAGPVLDLLVPE